MGKGVGGRDKSQDCMGTSAVSSVVRLVGSTAVKGQGARDMGYFMAEVMGS